MFPIGEWETIPDELKHIFHLAILQVQISQQFSVNPQALLQPLDLVNEQKHLIISNYINICYKLK